MDQSNTPLAPFRHRHDGWTPERQRAFLLALGSGACLKDACAAVGLSKTSAYRAKARMPEFAAAWDKALARISWPGMMSRLTLVRIVQAGFPPSREYNGGPDRTGEDHGRR